MLESYLKENQVLKLLFNPKMGFFKKGEEDTPYELNNVLYVRVAENNMRIKFRPMLTDNNEEPMEHIGNYPMSSIKRWYIDTRE